MNPLTNIDCTAIALPLPVIGAGTIKFAFVNVSPEIAYEWLKCNVNNRKVKEPTVELYHLDIRNKAWMLTHQGVAFDDKGNLIDGQHRLMAIIKANRAVWLLVSFGWPAQVKDGLNGGNLMTRDGVDRGVVRSLRDQLQMQHGIKDAGEVVKIINQIVASCTGRGRIPKASTDTILSVFEIYKTEILWLLGNAVKTHGFRAGAVVSAMVMGRAIWPEKTADFYSRLVTGANLATNSPILHLRNFILNRIGNGDPGQLRLACCHHLHAFVDGRTLSSLVSSSNSSHLKMLALQKKRVDQVCKIYNATCPPIGTEAVEQKTSAPASEAAPNNNTQIKAMSAEAAAIGRTLRDPFSTLDLSARLDGPRGRASEWIAIWARAKWIEGVGVGAFKKTATFGQIK